MAPGDAAGGRLAGAAVPLFALSPRESEGDNFSLADTGYVLMISRLQMKDCPPLKLGIRTLRTTKLFRRWPSAADSQSPGNRFSAAEPREAAGASLRHRRRDKHASREHGRCNHPSAKISCDPLDARVTWNSWQSLHGLFRGVLYPCSPSIPFLPFLTASRVARNASLGEEQSLAKRAKRGGACLCAR